MVLLLIDDEGVSESPWLQVSDLFLSMFYSQTRWAQSSNKNEDACTPRSAQTQNIHRATQAAQPPFQEDDPVRYVCVSSWIL
jgi:hypothetical protein